MRGGGTCVGDSGGPVIRNGAIVAVTNYGYTDNCRYLGGYLGGYLGWTSAWSRPGSRRSAP